MTRARGRPAQGNELIRADIITAALELMHESGEVGLTMRALSTRLGVSPMALYRHVEDKAGLIRAISDHVYAGVLQDVPHQANAVLMIRTMLSRYHDAVCQHPQLTLAVFANPQAYAGVTAQLTELLTTCLEQVATNPLLWRDVLVDHAHGSALALVSSQGEQSQVQALRLHYQQALELLLASMIRV
ncbi:TetR/AcrR family transcriptional regulator [Pseudomonas putida]|uniref:TetR/AcrR family transcriptional regulator n=1 Tax=Pseudomonas putida TaxID=303 RepID=UPI0021F82C21|nr:TetR/AcrR family transcriptional regulator [Pseudomonas putida]